MIVIAHITPSMNSSTSLQSQERKLRARIEKSLFLLQHDLPQSCEAAARHYPMGCKSSSCCSKGRNGGGTGRLARPSRAGTPGSPPAPPLQYEYFNENCTSRGVPTTDVIAAEPPDAPTTAGTGLLNDG